MGKDDLETHAVQVLDEPYQILALQVWNNVLILVPAEEVAKLGGKFGRSFVEVVELLQGIGKDHGDVWSG